MRGRDLKPSVPSIICNLSVTLEGTMERYTKPGDPDLFGEVGECGSLGAMALFSQIKFYQVFLNVPTLMYF